MTLSRAAFIGSSLRMSTIAAVGLPRKACAAGSFGSGQNANDAIVPVQVDARRLIRTVVGLRPFRSSGFVLRAEPFGGKVLVHN